MIPRGVTTSFSHALSRCLKDSHYVDRDVASLGVAVGRRRLTVRHNPRTMDIGIKNPRKEQVDVKVSRRIKSTEHYHE
jgi:hypothetical protein